MADRGVAGGELEAAPAAALERLRLACLRLEALRKPLTESMAVWRERAEAGGSPVEGLSPQAFYDVAVGHRGFSGEFGNGVGMGMALAPIYRASYSPVHALQQVLHFCDKPSQLTMHRHMPSVVDVVQQLGVGEENALEALTRSLGLVRRWEEGAAGMLDAHTLRSVREALAACEQEAAVVAGAVGELRAYAQAHGIAALPPAAGRSR